MKNVVNYILSAQKKIFVMAFLAVFSSFYTEVLGVDYVKTEILRDGEYVIGAVKGSATSGYIYAFDKTDDSSWGKGIETDSYGSTISNPSNDIVWILTTLESGGFALQNKANSIYIKLKASTGSGSMRINSDEPAAIYRDATGNNSTYEISGSPSFSVSSGNQLGYCIGSGYRIYANQAHQTIISNGSVSTLFRFYRKSETYTVTYNAGTGSCDTASLTEASAFSGVKLPYARTTAEGYTFAGWATASVDETKNSPILYKAGDTYYPTSNCTLYAVYVITSNEYKKVTSTANLSPGKYLVVNTQYGRAMKAAIKSSYYLDTTHVSISNNTITNPVNTIIWEVTKKLDTYQFYNSSTNKWLDNYYGSGHYLQLLSSKGKGYSLTIDESGNAIFSSNNDAGAMIRYPNNTYKFAGAASGSTSNVQLYKQDNTYNSNPTVCYELDDINGEVSWSSPANAEVSWDNIANVDSWTVNYKIHGAGEWTAWDGAQTVYTESETDDKRKVIITDLSCGRYYDFQIVASPAEDYCDKDETLDNSGSGYNSGGFTFWYGTTQGSEDHTECFSQVGETTTWLTDLWTIPSADQWTYVGEPFWNNDPGKSANLQLSNMPYALNHANNLGTIGTNVMEGAQGYIKINDDRGAINSSDHSWSKGFMLNLLTNYV